MNPRQSVHSEVIITVSLQGLVYTYTRTHTHARLSINAYTHTCIHIRIHTHIHTFTYSQIFANLQDPKTGRQSAKKQTNIDTIKHSCSHTRTQHTHTIKH